MQLVCKWDKHADGKSRTITFNCPDGKDVHLYYGVAGTHIHTLTLTDEQALELREFLNTNLICPDFIRASGDAICTNCNQTLYKHPKHPAFPWLVKSCSGGLFKL